MEVGEGVDVDGWGSIGGDEGQRFDFLFDLSNFWGDPVNGTSAPKGAASDENPARRQNEYSKRRSDGNVTFGRCNNLSLSWRPTSRIN